MYANTFIVTISTHHADTPGTEEHQGSEDDEEEQREEDDSPEDEEPDVDSPDSEFEDEDDDTPSPSFGGSAAGSPEMSTEASHPEQLDPSKVEYSFPPAPRPVFSNRISSVKFSASLVKTPGGYTPLVAAAAPKQSSCSVVRSLATLSSVRRMRVKPAVAGLENPGLMREILSLTLGCGHMAKGKIFNGTTDELVYTSCPCEGRGSLLYLRTLNRAWRMAYPAEGGEYFLTLPDYFDFWSC